MRINWSSRFKRAYKKLPAHVQLDFNNKLRIFASNPYEQSLGSHKLRGGLKESFAFKLKDGYRVLFRFIKSDEVDLLNVGPHDNYSKWV